MSWIDTIISICTCAIGLTQFLLWRYIAKNKAYEAKKGEYLATKQDIGDITNKIEEVKESYNKALEIHKIELQKDYYSSQYMIDLCNKIDKELIDKMIDCRYKVNGLMEEGFCISESASMANEIEKVYDHLTKYKTRYGTNEAAKKIINKYLCYQYIDSGEANISDMEFEEEVYGCLRDAMKGIDELLKIFLPSLKQ